MLIILETHATVLEAQNLLEKIQWMGFTAKLLGKEGDYSIALLSGVDSQVTVESFKQLPLVKKIGQINKPYKLVSRDAKQEKTIFSLSGVPIGGTTVQVIAGPCAIESKEHIDECAAIVAKGGAKLLRGGAFKPRTSPYSFQGLGVKGLQYLKEAAEKYGLISVSEVMDIAQVAQAVEYVDILQIGARNMQNFSLLQEVGKTKKPIFLKRGMSATYKDLLMSAEYILKQGNPNVILCERGIRTFETHLRNTLDVAAAAALQELTHLPVFIDPSHATGVQNMVIPMARAAVAANADGIMVEIHPDPACALCDKEQALSPDLYFQLMDSINKVALAVDRTI